VGLTDEKVKAALDVYPISAPPPPPPPHNPSSGSGGPYKKSPYGD